MLRFGFFEDFKGSDTLLIWGDTTGLSHLQKLLLDLGSAKDRRASLHASKWASSPQDFTVDFETSIEAPGVLRVEQGMKRVAIVVRCSTNQFAKFAEKVAALTDPTCKIRHQYLDDLESPGIQVMVSKGEYPPDFGNPS
jgi:hypothetical protein